MVATIIAAIVAAMVAVMGKRSDNNGDSGAK